MKRLIKFEAEWCTSCKALSKILETANIDLPIEVIDIDIHNEIAQEYGIRSVPTLVMLDENTEVKRLIGSKTVNQIQEWAV